MESTNNMEKGKEPFVEKENDSSITPHKKLTPRRLLCALAVEAFDKLIIEVGERTPVLKEIRDALLPCIFMEEESTNENTDSVHIPSTINESGNEKDSVQVTDNHNDPTASSSNPTKGGAVITGQRYRTKSLWCEDSSDVAQRLGVLESKLVESEAARASLEDLLTELPNYRNKIDSLNAELAKERHTIHHLQGDIRHKKELLKEKKQLLDDEVAAHANAKANYLAELRAKAKMQDEMQVLTSRVNTSTQQLNDAKKEIKELKAKAAEATTAIQIPQDVKASIMRASDVRAQLKESREDNENARRRIEDLCGMIRVFNTRLENLEKKKAAGREHVVANAGTLDHLNIRSIDVNDTSLETYLEYVEYLNAELLRQLLASKHSSEHSDSVIRSLNALIRERTGEYEQNLQSMEISHTRRLHEVHVLNKMKSDVLKAELDHIKKQLKNECLFRESLEEKNHVLEYRVSELERDVSKKDFIIQKLKEYESERELEMNNLQLMQREDVLLDQQLLRKMQYILQQEGMLTELRSARTKLIVENEHLRLDMNTLNGRIIGKNTSLL